MKILIFIIGSVFLLGSCKSYQEIDIHSPKIESYKKYKIITHKGKRIKSKILFNDDNTITYYEDKKEKILNISEIKSINGRLYSKEKTVNSFLITISFVMSIFFQ